MGVSPLDGARQRMALVLNAMERDFQKVRVGAASGSLLDAVLVDDHGRRVKLIEIASVAIPDPRQIVIRPWDPASLRAIGAAISQSRIGLTPTIDGGTIRLYVPELSEERRLDLVALIHERMERAKVEIRAARHEALLLIRADSRDHPTGVDEVARETDQLQRLTDRSIGEVERLGRLKQEAILRL